MDSVVSPLILQGQTPYQILENHPEIMCTEKTIYNYIASGVLSVKNLDLPRKVKYKLRKQHSSEINDKGIFEGRSYKDFLVYLEAYPDTNVVEMDTVVGCEGSHKVFLTLFFRNCKLMLIYLLPDKTAASVKKVFDRLEEKISTLGFCKTFPVILTDRGTEFSKPDELESGIDNIIRTSIYYCDPMASWQKPGIEKNHEYIRYVLPKGTSFDTLSQWDATKLASHINSTARASLNGTPPMKLAQMLLDKDAVNAFGLREISPDDIILTPKLLKK
jgi:IS30 family transposase